MPNLSPKEQADLEARREAHGHVMHFQISEAEALDLASGYVPLSVQAMAKSMLDWADEDRRAAARPVRGRKLTNG